MINTFVHTHTRTHTRTHIHTHTHTHTRTHTHTHIHTHTHARTHAHTRARTQSHEPLDSHCSLASTLALPFTVMVCFGMGFLLGVQKIFLYIYTYIVFSYCVYYRYLLSPPFWDHIPWCAIAERKTFRMGIGLTAKLLKNIYIFFFSFL